MTIPTLLEENGHRFVPGLELGFREGSPLARALVCKACGVVRPRNGGSRSQCHGAVKVTVR